MSRTNLIALPAADFVATQQETLEALLVKSKRSAVPLRRTFLQAGRSGGASTMAQLIRQHQALDLFLLCVAVASKEPWEVKIQAGVLGRALGWGSDRHGQLAVSRAAAHLERLQVIERFNLRRATGIRLLREDGSATPYTNPDGEAEEDRYLRIPLAYWLGGPPGSPRGWHNELLLPEKVVLLIGLARGQGFTLPEAKGPLFYGISEDTLHRGITGLINRGVLHREGKPRKAPLVGQGYTYENKYTLEPPFARSARKEVVPMKAPAG